MNPEATSSYLNRPGKIGKPKNKSKPSVTPTSCVPRRPPGGPAVVCNSHVPYCRIGYLKSRSKSNTIPRFVEHAVVCVEGNYVPGKVDEKPLKIGLPITACRVSGWSPSPAFNRLHHISFWNTVEHERGTQTFVECRIEWKYTYRILRKWE